MRPSATGLAAPAITMGIVRVASRAARVATAVETRGAGCEPTASGVARTATVAIVTARRTSSVTSNRPARSLLGARDSNLQLKLTPDYAALTR